MVSEVKHRKKEKKQSDGATESEKREDEEQKTKKQSGENDKKLNSHFKTVICLLTLASCGALGWVVQLHQQRFSLLEEKYLSLLGRTSRLLDMEQEFLRVSDKCDSLQLMLQKIKGQRQVKGQQQGALQAQLDAVQPEVDRLKEWTSGLAEKRLQFDVSLAALRDAVGRIEERTMAIAKDFANKVASVRTDIRRMDGLHSELDSLLIQLGNLENRTVQTEVVMVKRIGDVLASSIDRVSNLRSACERNTQNIEKVKRGLADVSGADDQIQADVKDLQSSRARLIRTLSLTSDLRPKVAAIRKDFGAFEPQLSDLTLRIGQLAEDLTEREREIAALRQTLANLTAVGGASAAEPERGGELSGLSNVGEIISPA